MKFLAGAVAGIFLGSVISLLIIPAVKSGARRMAVDKDGTSPYYVVKPLKILDLKVDNPPLHSRRRIGGGGNTIMTAADMATDSYKTDEAAVFSRDDKIIISYDVAELFALRPKSRQVSSGDSEPQIHIRQDLIVKNSSGDVLLVKPAIIDLKKPLSLKPARFINEIYLSAVKDLSPGDYAIEILVTDLVGFQTSKGVLKFAVKHDAQEKKG